MTSDQFQTLIRTLLNFGGGIAVGKGLVTEVDMGSITGLVTMIAAGAWGYFVHTPAQIMKAAETVKEKGLA